MIRRPPRSTLSSSSAASDVYKRQGLELRVGDCCLCDRREVIGVAEGAEVVHELGDHLWRRRNIVRGAWVVVAAADPVLYLPEAASMRLQTRAGKQTSMNFHEP